MQGSCVNSSRVIMFCLGPSRPRNDKDDPNRNDVSVFDWLSKRNNIMLKVKIVFKVA